jgi:hypothetical protein
MQEPRTNTRQSLLYRPARRVVFVGLSLGVHLLFGVALAAMAWKPWVPKIEVTWLDLDNTLGSPSKEPRRAPTPKPKPKPKAQPKKDITPRRAKGKRVASRKPKPKRHPLDAGVARPDARPSGTAGPELAKIAPGDAALMLLMRMDRIHKSPYEPAVRRLLEVFYDHKTLLWSSGLDPMKDFDAMLIATPNPYRVTQTFLAVRHHLSHSRMRRALGRSARFKGKRMRWSHQRRGVLRGEIPSPPKLPHDPRVVLMRERLVMLTDPKHLALLTTPAPQKPARKPGAPDAGVQHDWVEHLKQMDRVGSVEEGAPGLVLMAVNLPRLVRLPRDIPPPNSAKVTVPAREPAQIKAEMIFGDESTAQAFIKAVPKRIKRAKSSLLLRFLGVTDLLDRIRLTRKKERVLADVKLSGAEVRSLLELFRGMIPQVRVPGMPPRLPPDAGVPDAASKRQQDLGRGKHTDAGLPDAGARGPDAAGSADR